MKRSPKDAVMAAGLGCALSAQALLVTAESSLLSFDARIVEYLARIRTPAASSFFVHVSSLGNPAPMALIILAGAYALHRFFRREHLAFGFLIAAGGSVLSEMALKDLIARARPWDFSVIHELSFSFPSGHASVAAAVYGFLAYALWHAPVRRTARMAGTAALTALVLAIGFSRIYLGVHYPTDVLAGFFVGIVWVVLGVHASRMHEKHRGRS